MTLTVARRFRGPARSGNGGYTAGLLAERLLGTAADPVRPVGSTVRVRLHVPPPLETALAVDVDADVDPDSASATLRRGSTVVATATRSTLERETVPAIGYSEVAAAVGPFAGATDHPFPGCFVCGPDRAEGDGLRLFPGAVEPGRTATTWEPDPTVADERGVVPPEIVWAALDCPGGWSSDLTGRPMVLGTMTAEVLALPAVGDRCVVVGRLDGADDRRSSTSTALYGDDGALLARAEHIWVRVDPALFEQLTRPTQADPAPTQPRPSPRDHESFGSL